MQNVDFNFSQGTITFSKILSKLVSAIVQLSNELLFYIFIVKKFKYN